MAFYTSIADNLYAGRINFNTTLPGTHFHNAGIPNYPLYPLELVLKTHWKDELVLMVRVVLVLLQVHKVKLKKPSLVTKLGFFQVFLICCKLFR